MSTTPNQNSLFEDPYLGMVIDGCIIERKLGQGGMGAVYQGRHLTLEKYVAIKILPPEFSMVPVNVERFLREARSAAKLEHPNIVQVFNAGQQNNVHFIAMQFVSGQSLQSHINKLQRIPLPETLWIMKASMQGLLFAHEHGIIHRDIKPDNIMITASGEVKVVDFGLARSAEAGNTLSNPGQIFGTPHFMSPEQCNGNELDLRSDIYSLGITFYYMLSGKRPYEGGQAVYILMQHANPKEPTKVLDTEQLPIPLELAKMIRKMMEKDREQRYQSLAEVLQALEPILLKHPPTPLLSEENSSFPPRREPSSGNLAVTDPPEALSRSTTPAPSVYSHPTTSPSVAPQNKGSVRKAQVNAPSPLSDYTPPTRPSTIPPPQKNTNKGMQSQGMGSAPTADISLTARSSQTTYAAHRPFVSRPQPTKGLSKKLLILGMSIGVLMAITVWFQNKSREVAYQKQMTFVQEELSRLRQEKPIDFDAIRQLFAQMQQQYPESLAWCKEQTQNLDQEEKTDQKKMLQDKENELRKQTPVEFAKLRLIYHEYAQKYGSELAWCQEKIKEFYHEELELLFQEKRLIEASALLANPFWKRYSRDQYPQFIAQLQSSCNEIYEDHTQFLKKIATHELELLKLYQNILLLEEPNLLSQTLYLLSTRSETALKNILATTETPQILIFLDCFSFALQIRKDDNLRPLLDILWKEKLEPSFFSFIQEKINTYTLEELNKLLEAMITFRDNTLTKSYFQALEETLIRQIIKLPFEEKNRLKQNLQNTSFPQTFLRALEAFSLDQAIAILPIPEKDPLPTQTNPEFEDEPKHKRNTAYKATAEELRLAMEDLREKFNEVLLNNPPPFMGEGKRPPKQPKHQGPLPHEDPEVRQRLEKVKELFNRFVSEGDLSDPEFVSFKNKVEARLLALPPPLNEEFSRF